MKAARCFGGQIEPISGLAEFYCSFQSTIERLADRFERDECSLIEKTLIGHGTVDA